MSGLGDSGGPSAGEELSAASITSAVEDNTSKNVMASTLPKDDGDQNSPLTLTYKADNPFNVEIGAMEEDLEAVIEKKLNLEKEKALDIDSEDFELKWDDDDDATNGLNDDVSAMETETVAQSNINPSTIANQLDAPIDDKSKHNVTPLATANQTNVISVSDIFKVDTSVKIDLANKPDSETNSLDEHLVYSDVDVPEIEDKELLDELDAHISKTDKNVDSMDEETNPVVPEATQETSDNMCQNDLNSTEMDVDHKISKKVEKPDLNDTVSTITEADASTYDINMEHKLGNLDAMIEIPTQELIEDLDDSGDFEEGEQYDEDLLLQNDTEVKEPEGIVSPVKDIENIATQEQAKPEKSTIKEVLNIAEFDTDLEDKLLADTVETTDGIATTENTEIDTEMISEDDSNMIESSKLDKMIEMIDKDIEITEKENYADIILEASHQESGDLIASTDNIKEMEPSTNIETFESAPTIDVVSKVDTKVDKSTSIVDIATDDSIVSEEAKELSNVKDINPTTNETKEITQSEQNTNTTLALQATEITELEELAPIMNIETEEVTSVYFSKDIKPTTNETKEITQSEQNTNTTLALHATEIVDLEELAPIVNIVTEEVTSVYFSKGVSDIKIAKIGDFIDNALSSTSKSSDVQLEDAESQNIEIDTAQSVQKDFSDSKYDDFTNKEPSTFKTDDLQLKESESKSFSIDTVEPLPKELEDAKVDDFVNAQSTFISDDLQLKEPETKKVNIDTAEPLPKELADAKVDDFISAQLSTSKLEDIQPKQVEAKNVDLDMVQPSISKTDDLQPIESEQNNLDTDSAQPSTPKIDDLQPKESEPNNMDIDLAQPSTLKIDDLQPIESEPMNLDIDLAQPSTSKIDDLQPKESEPNNLDIDFAQPSTLKIDNLRPIESEPKNLDIDSAQPSTSKIDDLQPIESEPMNLDIDSAQPSTSKIDDLQPKESVLKNLDIDSALPSTSKIDDLQPKESVLKNLDVDLAQPSTLKIDNLLPIESEPKNLDIDSAQPSTSKIDDLQPRESVHNNLDIDIVQPSTSKADNLDLKETEAKSIDINAELPSTSNMMQELSDEDQETDTLGLLAESSRVMDDDDEQEQEQDDDDDDDDFDQDEESNQMIAEHSEDSNAQHSETDVPQETMDVEPTEADKEFPGLPEVVSSDVELTEPVVEESIEVNENEVEMAVTALISSNLEEDSVDAQAVSDVDVKLSSEDSDSSSKLRNLLTKDRDKDGATEVSEVTSPSKVKKLEISKPNHEYNIVDLEGSSSEDDVQEVNKPDQPVSTSVTSVNIPSEVEVMAAGGELSKLTQREGEVVISVPKPPPHKPARLNTGEVTIKTGVITVAEPMLIPEATVSLKDPKPKLKPKAGLEIFNLDSDDEDKEKESKKSVEELKCINVYCTSDGTVPRTSADAAAAAYYGGARRGAVCTPCALRVQQRTQSLIEGIKDLTPLLSFDMGQIREELVEISDSDSDDEIEVAKKPEDAIGEITAKFLEENLEDMFNSTWLKYNMDERLHEAQKQIDIDVLKIEEDCKEIDSMLSECQAATDKLRRDLYDTFAHERKELPPIMIFDTPTNMWSGLEEVPYEKPELPTRQSKRRLQAATEPPAKKPAIPLGYTPLDSDNKTKDVKVTPAPTNVPIQNEDDNADISVVKLSAEAAPAGLPPVGAARRPPLRPQMQVYAMRNAFGAWLKAKIVDVQPKIPNAAFTMCRVKFEHKVKNPCKLLPARCLAYEHPSEVRMTIGTRVIALFADTQTSGKSYYSGIVAEIPNPVNNYRYLVFFDDGYAQYVQHAHTRLVCECAPLVWDEVHPFSRQFVRDYLRAYPERPMVRAHAGQSLKTEWNGRWWVSKVIQVDASLVQVHFEEDNRTEWIYRGSTRLAPLYLELQAAERQRARPLPRAAPGRKVNMPYVEYTRSDEPAAAPPPTPTQAEQELRRQRAVAKKSTALAQPPPTAPLDGVSSRVVFYTPKKTIRPHKMVPHNCGPRCRRTDVLALKDLRTYNPLTKPLLSGWERQIVKYRFTKSVMYRAPCGRRLRDYRELHRYLQAVGSDMGVDLFDFGVHTHCLAEFVLNKCLVSKKDLSHGKENVPVPCVNYYDSSLPEFCSYNTERTPTAGVPLNLDPEFLCGCDCTDDCADKNKCACWKMTLEGARTIGLDTNDVGYVYKRLPEPLPSGIYECNSRCKCRQTCLNRVAQHPLQLKLQVFKTLNRGWGIRALNDVPKGAFLCVYAGNLLTDATANLDGLNEGDEYLAELDYIEVVEQMKEGFEEDIPDEDKKLDKEAEDSSSSSSSSEEEQDQRKDPEDADFRPEGWLQRSQVSEYSKRLRKRDKTKKKDRENKDKSKEKQREKDGSGDDCITISDDEELREPARFAAQAGMGGKEFVSKYKSVRAHFGRDEACYIMDAKVQGNIGRYLNHSCTPNVFVQNVFVDTHDPRFPWVAFFALTHIRAGTELTWNYNYDVGSVPGKVLYCHCAAPNCRGRLL